MAGWIVVAVVVAFLLIGNANSSSGSRRSPRSAPSRPLSSPPRFSSSASASSAETDLTRHPVLDGALHPADRCTCGGTWIRHENSETRGRFWGCSNFPRCSNTRDDVMRSRYGPYWKEIERPELAKCSHGHPRTTQNTAHDAAGHRVCLDCRPPPPPPARKAVANSPDLRPWKARTTPSSLAVCRNGHPRTPENTYVRPDGERECKICRKLARRR